MTILDQLTSRAAARQRHIVLAEGSDQRIVRAGLRAAHDGIAQITILGEEDAVRQIAGGAAFDANVHIVDPARFDGIAGYAQLYQSTLRRGNITEQTAIRSARKPLNFAHLMVRSGAADGALAGATYSSAQVIRSASQIIGQDPDHALVSSFFLMVMEEGFHDRKELVAFADCALVVDPNAQQLAHIAAATADSMKSLFNLEPKLAILSFATGGSADPAIRKVIDAGIILGQLRPDIPFAAPIQFDAAFDPEVATIKAAPSTVAGKANIFIFPDLNAGNIGYKIAERIGKAKAIGPVLQGFGRPINDLSRGCTEDDIYTMIALTAVQAQSTEPVGTV